MEKKQRENRTKIIATLGPASSDEQVLKQMIRAGVNVCRINGSHGSHHEQKMLINLVRHINDETGGHTAILYDLQGPKLRIGDLPPDGMMLEEGHELLLNTQKKEAGKNEVFVQYPDIGKDVKKGEIILVDDGRIALRVKQVNDHSSVKTEVIHGGLLTSRKGINLPDTKISLPSLTPKDLADLSFALDHDVEWIGLSFVRSSRDILELKKIIAGRKKTARVIAKIEKPEALVDISAIIDLTDGLMVARGDLGVEMPMEQVPLIQKDLVRKCIDASKPVIIATQMMESMITNFRPTRAEVNDVANAVLDGADALMLSAETSVGKFPVQVIQYMHKIITMSESEHGIYYRGTPPVRNTPSFISDTISFNACIMAKHAGATMITAMTHSGYTAFELSSQRPEASILIFTDNRTLLNTLSMVWGVQGFFYDKYESTDQTIADLKDYIKEGGFVRADDLVINLASMPMKEKGRTNMLKLSYIQ